MNRLTMIIAMCVVILSGCATTHTVEEYIGRVIDSDTKKPLEGAVVLAIYSTRAWSDVSYAYKGKDTAYYSTLTPLAAQETTTNKNGEFKIPSITIIQQHLLNRPYPNAQFVIFKPGYGNYPANKTVYVRYPARGDSPQFDQQNEGYLRPLKYLTIELPLLTSPQARALNVPAINFDVPYENQKIFLSAISSELILLKLPEYYSDSYFKKEFSSK